MSELKKITKEIREELRAEFPKEAYASHPTKSFLTVLKAMYVIERLNDVFGVGRWRVDTNIEERTKDYVLVKGKFVSLDYEVTIPDQYGGHKTTGTNTEMADGYKSAVTDCISKLASYLEIGIDMFKGKIKVESSKKTNSNQQDDRLWLNKYTNKAQTEITKQWNNVLGAIEKGEVASIEQIEHHYKISKETKEELKKLL